MPIRARLTLAVAVTASLFMLVAGFAFVTVLQAHLVGDIDQTLLHRADALLHPSPGRLFPAGTGGAEHGLSFLGPNGVSAIQVYSDTTSPLSSFSLYGSAHLLGARQLAQARVTPSFFTTTLAGYPHSVRVLAEPVPSVPGDVLAVAASLEGVDQATGQVAGTLAVLGLVLVVLATAGAWLFGGSALHPVERLRQQAAILARDGGEELLDVPPTHDEIASLAATMNEVLLRLRRALARQREFVSDAGHELRTPLATLAVELELALRPNRSRAELEDALRQAQGETSRLVRLAEDLLLLARSDEDELKLQLQSQLLAPVLESAIRTVAHQAQEAGVVVELQCPSDLLALVDPPTFSRSIVNLLDNALRYAPSGSAIAVTAGQRQSIVEVTVSDSGPGFPPEYLPSAFDRFTRPDGARGRLDGGNGLGLSIVRTIARAHGGDATAGNASQGGAVVVVTVRAGTPSPP